MDEDHVKHPLDDLNVRFWGVRGSLAAPGQHTAKFGGNTSCVEVTHGGTSILFDAGTGIRNAGSSLLARNTNSVSLFFSHLHWDHIQGFPFFAPAYVPSMEINVYGPAPEEDLRDSLARQMCPPNFPIRFDELKSHIRLQEVHPGTLHVVGKMRVTAAHLNHPGGVLGYRVETSHGAIVYSTDHEHGTEADERLIELARGADILIYDAMYTPEEYSGQKGPSKKGWGHSTYEEGAKIAKAAGVRNLVLFHHDPERKDEDLENLLVVARQHFQNTTLAQEGVCLSATAPRPPSRRPEIKVA